MNKAVLLIIVFLLLVTSVSAATFDNVKTFNPEKSTYGEIEIKNLFGLGDTLAKYTLLSNSDSCLTDCYAEGTLELFEQSLLFDSIDFGGKTVDYTLYLEQITPYNEQIPVYKTTCNPFELPNKSIDENCVKTIDKINEVTKYKNVWIEYDNSLLVPDNYRWRIEGTKKIDESVDWIGSVFGVEMDEWAWWNSTCTNQISLEYTNTYITDVNLQLQLNVSDVTSGDINNDEKMFFYDVTGARTLKWWDYNLDIAFFNLSVNAGTDFEIGLYYGNCGQNASNVSDVMLYGNDFESIAEINAFGNNADNGVWVFNNTNFQHGNGSAYATTANNFKTHDLFNLTNTSVVVYMETKGTDVQAGKLQRVTTRNHTAANNGVCHFTTTSTDFFCYGQSSEFTSTIPLPETWVKIKTQLNDTTMCTFAYENDTLVDCHSTGINTTRVQIYSDFTTNYGFDNLFVYRDYGGFNPTVTATKVVQGLSLTVNYNATSTETKMERFNLTVEINDTFILNTSLSANLHYNGTIYPATGTLLTNNLSLQTVDLQLPLSLSSSATEIRRFFFNVSFQYQNGSDGAEVTATQLQTVRKVNITICDASNTIPFVNFSFKDEKAGTTINASIQSSTFYFGANNNLALNRSYIYQNLTDQFSYVFCGQPTDETLYTAYEIRYDSEGYEERGTVDLKTLTSGTTNITLFLLATLDGQFVTFQVVNTANQAITGASVTVVNPSGNQIAQDITDAAGTVTFFLDPNQLYTLTFIASGFDDVIFVIRPAITEYTITMGVTAVEEGNNLYRGISYDILPRETLLFNNTIYNFSFQIASTHFSLESAGFDLINSTNSTIGSATCTGATGCTASTNVNTLQGTTSIRMDYFWVIEGNRTTGSHQWNVRDYDTNQSSFELLKKDLNAFGIQLDPFTKMIISMLIIMMAVGILTFASGQTSPMAILLFVFAIVGFLDIVNLLPEIGNTAIAPHFVTILTGLVVLGFVLFERFGR